MGCLLSQLVHHIRLSTLSDILKAFHTGADTFHLIEQIRLDCPGFYRYAALFSELPGDSDFSRIFGKSVAEWKQIHSSTQTRTAQFCQGAARVKPSRKRQRDPFLINLPGQNFSENLMKLINRFIIRLGCIGCIIPGPI